MNIVELSSKQNNKYVTVSMSYDELRDISNGLYEVSQSDKKYKGIYAKCKTLFDLVKHGTIQPETIETLHTTNTSSVEVMEEKTNHNVFIVTDEKGKTIEKLNEMHIKVLRLNDECPLGKENCSRDCFLHSK